jgi:cell division protease FtsH
MEKRQKVSIWYVLLGIWIVLILQNFITTMFAIKTVPYSEFLKLLKEKKVTEVAISANQIQGKIKENATGKEQMFRTVRVDSDTSKLLEQYNVKFKGEIESRFLPTLLSWIVPVFLFIGVILLAATNRPEILDPALLRPGRFDRNILVDRPDKKGREEILKVHLKNIKVSEDVDLSVLAGMTPGMVGADLANLINEAALLAVRRNKKKAGMPEFEEAVERVVAGLEKKNRLINPREREIVAYHEMGHALVAISLPGTDPVQKISIIPRGIAALGYTMQTPTEDRFLMNKSELLNRIATLLGGRAAEEIVFEDISTGAHSDLARATDIARSMVKEYGMSAKVGQVYFARGKRAQFLNIPMEGAVEYSEATAELIDGEVKDIVNQQYARALEILQQKREVLAKGANLLLEKEKIEGEELKALMGETESPSASVT